jgi:D-beta-D-heptose 7-phosphate kinase/D-beta-D-heptose 1-phosphate adenosyltransferase
VTTVFTNGCFDVLHVGHVRCLQWARAQGDKLVVGLNSDASVRRLKGETRPVFPQAERREMLLALKCVDEVIVFYEDTPLELIRRLRPDVLVKGADYAGKAIAGAELVKEVRLCPLVAGRSTTGTLARL